MESASVSDLQIKRASQKDREYSPRMVWVYPDSLAARLDTATWVDTSAELQDLGWRVTLVAIEAPAAVPTNGPEIVTLSFPRIYLLGQLLFHLAVVSYVWRQRDDVDIVYFTQLSGLWLLPFRFLRGLLGRKKPLLIMDVRDLDDFVAGSLRVRVRIWYQTAVLWLGRYLADGQTAITPQMAKLVGIPKRKLLGLWPSGVQLDRFKVSAQSRVWPCDEQPVRLVYIGILLPKRNPIALCKAVLEANRLGMNVTMTFVGSGPAKEEIEAFAERSGGMIEVRKPVDHAKVPGLLSEYHVGVTSLPEISDIKYQASSPIKLFEYMAAGMPIVASRNICHTQVAGDAPYMFWADSVSDASLLRAITQAWDKREHYEYLGSLALQDADQWSWRAAAEKLDMALCEGLTRANI